MSETKFTPGPWGLCAHLQSSASDQSCPCGYRGGIWGPDGEQVICEIGSHPVLGQEGLEGARYSRDVELANASLIAAAPDMYEALKLIWSMFDDGRIVRNIANDGHPDWALKMLTFTRELQTVHAAIAKAEGHKRSGADKTMPVPKHG